MRIRRIISCFLALAVFVVLGSAQEPVKPKLTPSIVTATRQVALFSGLEKKMLGAVQKKDKAAVQALLSDDFEIAMPEADPLPGDDWLDAVMANDFSLKSFVIRQLSVVDLGDSAIVKFDRLQQATYKSKDEGGEFFVVDLWKRSGDSWKLANRYVGRVGNLPANFKLEPKPTGKQ